MKQLLHIFIVLLYFTAHINGEEKDTCPPLQKGCDCTHKKKGLRIECRDVDHVSFTTLSSNVSMEIDLSSNRLTFLNASTFPHPNKIRKLILKNNMLRKIEEGTFEGFNALKKLDLSENYLVEVKASTFQGLGQSNISELILSRNRILQISKVAFAGLNIEFLDLREQMNWKKQAADILSFSDFLSFSIVKYVDLGMNNLLCDCNIKWLIMWSSNRQVSSDTKCYYPEQLRGLQLKNFAPDWQCNLLKHEFKLPEFHLVPYHDQVMFENDAIEYYCYSTWMELTTIKWYKNGRPLKSSPGMKITPSVNLTLASFSSKLTIDRLRKDFYGDITCEVDVGISGRVTKTRKLFLISNDLETCEPNATKTERGIISWPTSYAGTTISSKCPFGSLSSQQFASRKCNAGSVWGEIDVSSCLFDNPATQLLQKYLMETKSHSFPRIVQMANEFSKNFVLNYHLIQSKYDFYFLYRILHEITVAYKGYDGQTYSSFFWNATGMIADNHLNVPSMKELVYGHTSGWRFRNLLEEFVREQTDLDMYKAMFLLNTHHSMTAASYSFTASMTGELHCYVTNQHSFQVHCYPKRNYEANKVSTMVVFLNVGTNVRIFRFTILAFKTSTFFQSNKQSVREGSKLSSIIGLKLSAKMKDGSERKVIPGLRLTFSKSAFKLSNPRLVFWSTPNGEDVNAEWKSPISCVQANFLQKNASIYQCQYFNTFNMTYVAVMTNIPLPVHLDPNYLLLVVYVCAAITCIFLLFTLIVYVYFCYVRRVLYNRTDSAALMNFCIALLVGEVIFAIGIHRVDDRLLCTGVAVGLHYFLISALVWLGCGGVALLRLVKKKDRADVSIYDPVMKYYLIGWGLPLIICSITVAYDHHRYGTDRYCWLRPKTSLGAFIGVGSCILLADLIVFCFLHAAINRLFPEPIEGELGDDDENSEKRNEDGNCNRDQCDAKQCRYTKQAKKKGNKIEIPKRRELLQQLHAGLLILLFMVLTITFVSMIYTSKRTSSRFLYSFFTYGSACFNVFIGITVFYFHCVRRRDLQKLILQTIFQTRYQQADNSEATTLVNHQDNGVGDPLVSNNDDLQAVERSSAYLEALNTGVYGLSDHVVSDGSQIIPSIALEVVRIPEKVDETAENSLPPSYNEILDQIIEPQKTNPDRKAPISQSELSEAERMSNTHNSIGECSLASSSRKKAPPKTIEIPQNLKNFVPENWRPARRRMNKGASYYPYYVSDANPISASIAYSSKSSSLASTTVSGVPLFKHTNGVRPHTAMATPMIHQPHFPANVPIRFTPPPPHYTSHHPPTVNPLVDTQSHQAIVENHTKLSQSPPPPVIEENDALLENPEEVEEKESEEEEEMEEKSIFVVSPDLYIPMPHVSIKQFVLRHETSV